MKDEDDEKGCATIEMVDVKQGEEMLRMKKQMLACNFMTPGEK